MNYWNYILGAYGIAFLILMGMGILAYRKSRD